MVGPMVPQRSDETIGAVDEIDNSGRIPGIVGEIEPVVRESGYNGSIVYSVVC